MLSAPLKSRIPEDDQCLENVYNQKISMSATETDIINIPFRIMTDIFTEANLILNEKDGIVAVPGQNEKAFYVLYISQRDPRFVKAYKETKNITCEGKGHRWNGYKFCSHMVAVAEHLNILEQFVRQYKVKTRKTNITDISNTNIPSNSGKKRTKSTSIRKGSANKKQETVTEYIDPSRSGPAISSGDQLFHITFLAGLVRKCYGCGQEFTQRNRNPPHDVILKSFENREYISPKSKVKNQTCHKQNAYYHLNTDCVRKRHPRFEKNHIIVNQEIQDQLTDGHRNVLRQFRNF